MLLHSTMGLMPHHLNHDHQGVIEMSTPQKCWRNHVKTDDLRRCFQRGGEKTPTRQMFLNHHLTHHFQDSMCFSSLVSHRPKSHIEMFNFLSHLKHRWLVFFPTNEKSQSTLPATNSLPLKMDLSKMNVAYQPSIFRCYCWWLVHLPPPSLPPPPEIRPYQGLMNHWFLIKPLFLSGEYIRWGVWLISLWPMIALGSVRSSLLPPGLCRLLATPASCAPCTAPPPHRGPTLAALVRVVLSMMPCKKKKQGDSPSGMAVRVICLEGWRWRPNARNASNVFLGPNCLNGFFFLPWFFWCIVFGEIFMIHIDSLIVWDDGWTSLTSGDHNDPMIFHLPPWRWETPFLHGFCLFTKLKLTPLQILPQMISTCPQIASFSNRRPAFLPPKYQGPSFLAMFDKNPISGSKLQSLCMPGKNLTSSAPPGAPFIFETCQVCWKVWDFKSFKCPSVPCLDFLFCCFFNGLGCLDMGFVGWFFTDWDPIRFITHLFTTIWDNMLGMFS